MVVESMDNKTTFRIKWKDDCTYKLAFKRSNSPSRYRKGDTLYCKIVHCNEDYCEVDCDLHAIMHYLTIQKEFTRKENKLKAKAEQKKLKEEEEAAAKAETTTNGEEKAETDDEGSKPDQKKKGKKAENDQDASAKTKKKEKKQPKEKKEKSPKEKNEKPQKEKNEQETED